MNAILDAEGTTTGIRSEGTIPAASGNPNDDRNSNSPPWLGATSFRTRTSLRRASAIASSRGHTPPCPLPAVLCPGVAQGMLESARTINPVQPSTDQRPRNSQPALAGLASDFDSFYRTYQRRVLRQCLRMLRDQADAEDLTQEVFPQVFRKASTFRGESRVSTWLHRVTINIVLMYLRKQRRRPFTTALLGGSPSAEDDNAGGHEVVSTCQTSSTSTFDRMSLEIAMAQMSSGYRKIFVLHDVEGYGHEEIAKLLGISVGTSKSQLHKARHRLRVLLHKGRGKSPCSSAAPSSRRGAERGKRVSRIVQLAMV